MLHIAWESDAPELDNIQLEIIDHFNARGKRLVYGRGDHFPNHGEYNMDIWKDKYERLFVRFWSRKSDVDWMSFELSGVITENLDNTAIDDDSWIPQILREEYDNWILSEI